MSQRDTGSDFQDIEEGADEEYNDDATQTETKEDTPYEAWLYRKLDTFATSSKQITPPIGSS